jgi:23S rRNA (adenine-N6)-dimethyltransferase
MSKRSPRDARRRALAQNFLVDDQVIASLVNELRAEPDSLVLDLGAGRGALTEPLAALGARTLAVERDSHLVDHLRRKANGWGRVEVKSADIMRMSFPAEPHLIISNAPYNIGTGLVRRIMSEAHGFRRAVVLLQAETARRLAGTPRGGRFAATWAPWFRFELGSRIIGPECFRPRPSVQSAVLIVEPRPDPLLSPAAHGEYERFLDQVFGADGASLQSRLKPLASGRMVRRLISGLDRPAGVTPGELCPAEYAGIFAAIKAAGNG